MVQVKEDVAWLLEDTSDGGWKPVKDDGHVKVRYKVQAARELSAAAAAAAMYILCRVVLSSK